MKLLQMIWFLVLATFLPSFVNNVFGQDEQMPPEKRAPLTTDRPSFTTDSKMITPGEVQLELGFTFTDMEHSDSFSAPETLVRYGWNDEWELRFGWDGYDFGTEDGDIANNVFVGYKKKLKDSGEHLWLDNLDNVSMALIAEYRLPTGHGPNNFETKTMLGWDLELDESTSLAGNLGFGSPKDSETGDRYIQGLSSIMVRRIMGEMTTVFGEFYTNFPAADDEDAEYIVQSGFTHCLDDDTQLDFRFGIGLNEQAPDWLVGFGFSKRF